MAESEPGGLLDSRIRSCLDRLALLAPIRYLFDRRTSTMTTGQGRGLRFSSGRSNYRYRTGDNEIPVQNALAEHLVPGAVFLDVGANVGFLTVIGARLVGAQGSVYAFEPVRENAALVRRNVRQNGFKNVVIIEQAVSNHTGTEQLVLAAYSGGAALATADRPPDAVREIRVPTITIDEAVSTGIVRVPAMVKIDVEGAEIQVLQGMNRTIDEHRPVILYEVDGPDAATVKAKASLCREFVEARGYAVSRLEDSYPGIRWCVEHYLATSTAA